LKNQVKLFVFFCFFGFIFWAQYLLFFGQKIPIYRFPAKRSGSSVAKIEKFPRKIHCL